MFVDPLINSVLAGMVLHISSLRPEVPNIYLKVREPVIVGPIKGNDKTAAIALPSSCHCCSTKQKTFWTDTSLMAPRTHVMLCLLLLLKTGLQILWPQAIRASHNHANISLFFQCEEIVAYYVCLMGHFVAEVLLYYRIPVRQTIFSTVKQLLLENQYQLQHGLLIQCLLILN